MHAEAIKIASQYKLGPLYTPPIVADTNGKLATLMLPSHVGGANWPGGALDAETGVLYVSSVTQQDPLALTRRRPKRSDMGYVGGGRRGGRGGPAGRTPIRLATRRRQACVRLQKTNIGPAGAAVGQATMGPDHGHRSEFRRSRLDDPQRAPAGLREESSRR